MKLQVKIKRTLRLIRLDGPRNVMGKKLIGITTNVEPGLCFRNSLQSGILFIILK